jgi:hypothetical protein
MIIGIGFTARSGKDTIASYLVERYDFQSRSFADPLKEACSAIFHLSREQLYGSLKEVVDPYWGVTPRYILQKVGTECMRNVFDKDIWIKSARSYILQHPHYDYVFPDCRFLNEVTAIKEWGGKLVRVTRPVCGAPGGIVGHASEMELCNFDGWDYTIHNDGTFDSLYRKVDSLVELIRP